MVTYTSYSRGGPGVSLASDQGLSEFRTLRRHHASGRQRHGAAAAENRWLLGADSSANDDARSAHVDFLLSRPALLGQAQAHAGSAPRRLVGRQQNRVVTPAHRNVQRMARLLPRRTAHAFRLSVSLGLALFDLENPEKCLLRGDSWIFGPEAPYERHGDVDDVVFPCGYTMDADGDTLNLYYGAADCSIALARASVRSLLEWLDVNGNCERRQRAKICEVPIWNSPFCFGCRHRHKSGVFTIKKRTYQVCLNCGQEFEYSWNACTFDIGSWPRHQCASEDPELC